jgi:hypothetical protein
MPKNRSNWEKSVKEAKVRFDCSVIEEKEEEILNRVRDMQLRVCLVSITKCVW